MRRLAVLGLFVGALALGAPADGVAQEAQNSMRVGFPSSV